MIEAVVAAFLLGAAAGIAWYRRFLHSMMTKHTYTACDYCEFFAVMKGAPSGKRASSSSEAEGDTESYT